MVFDGRVVTNMVTTPKRHVVTNVHERLNRVVLENETVVADWMIGQERAAATHVTHQLVALLFRLEIFLFAKLVHASVAQRDKHPEFTGRVTLRDLFKRDE